MAELYDFLGHILKAVTIARMQADFAATEAAKMYVADEDGLLKNFPAPHMRIDKLVIKAPIIINEVPDSEMEKTDPELFKKTVTSSVIKALKDRKITIGTKEINKIITDDIKISQGYINKSTPATLSSKIGDNLSLSKTSSKIPIETHKEITSIISNSIKETIKLLPRTPVGIQINAKSSAVKEYTRSTENQDSSIMCIDMTITEDAMDIILNDPVDNSTDGKLSIKRLIPE
jgi:hypothetical protein